MLISHISRGNSITSQDRVSGGEPGRIKPPPRVSIGLVVVGSLATGLLAALAVVAVPFIEANEIALTGGILVALAAGSVSGRLPR